MARKRRGRKKNVPDTSNLEGDESFEMTAHQASSALLPARAPGLSPPELPAARFVKREPADEEAGDLDLTVTDPVFMREVNEILHQARNSVQNRPTSDDGWDSDASTIPEPMDVDEGTAYIPDDSPHQSVGDRDSTSKTESFSSNIRVKKEPCREITNKDRGAPVVGMVCDMSTAQNQTGVLNQNFDPNNIRIKTEPPDDYENHLTEPQKHPETQESRNFDPNIKIKTEPPDDYPDPSRPVSVGEIGLRLQKRRLPSVEAPEKKIRSEATSSSTTSANSGAAPQECEAEKLMKQKHMAQIEAALEVVKRSFKSEPVSDPTPMEEDPKSVSSSLDLIKETTNTLVEKTGKALSIGEYRECASSSKDAIPSTSSASSSSPVSRSNFPCTVPLSAGVEKENFSTELLMYFNLNTRITRSDIAEALKFISEYTEKETFGLFGSDAFKKKERIQNTTPQKLHPDAGTSSEPSVPEHPGTACSGNEISPKDAISENFGFRTPRLFEKLSKTTGFDNPRLPILSPLSSSPPNLISSPSHIIEDSKMSPHYSPISTVSSKQSIIPDNNPATDVRSPKKPGVRYAAEQLIMPPVSQAIPALSSLSSSTPVIPSTSLSGAALNISEIAAQNINWANILNALPSSYLAPLLPSVNANVLPAAGTSVPHSAVLSDPSFNANSSESNIHNLQYQREPRISPIRDSTSSQPIPVIISPMTANREIPVASEFLEHNNLNQNGEAYLKRSPNVSIANNHPVSNNTPSNAEQAKQSKLSLTEYTQRLSLRDPRTRKNASKETACATFGYAPGSSSLGIPPASTTGHHRSVPPPAAPVQSTLHQQLPSPAPLRLAEAALVNRQQPNGVAQSLNVQSNAAALLPSAPSTSAHRDHWETVSRNVTFSPRKVQWNPKWLKTQLETGVCPPICDSYQSARLSYNDAPHYYGTYIPLHMLSVWFTLFEQWKNNIAYFSCVWESSCDPEGYIACSTKVRRADDAQPKRDDIILCTLSASDPNSEDVFLHVKNVLINKDKTKLMIKLRSAAERLDVRPGTVVRMRILLGARVASLQYEDLSHMDPGIRDIVTKPGDHTQHIELARFDVGINMKPLRDEIMRLVARHRTRVVLFDSKNPYDVVQLITLLAYKLYKENHKVLVCMKNEESFDKLAKRLKVYDPVLAVRTKEIEIDEELKDFTLDHRLAQKGASVEDIQRKCGIFITTFSAFVPRERDFLSRVPRLTCIVDEAHMCTEAETALPLRFMVRKLVLMGNEMVTPSMPQLLRCSRYDVTLFHRLLQVMK